MWAVRSVAGDPGVDLLGGLRSIGEVIAKRLAGWPGVRTDGGMEEEENGGGLEAEL
jgi:hypothetical protein